MDELRKVCKEATCRTHPNPPGGEIIFDEGVKEDLYAAAKNALLSGVKPEKVYVQLCKAYEATEDGLSRKLEKLLLAHGLHPDAKVGSTCVLLHRLSGSWPPPCRPVNPQEIIAKEVYLNDYLDLAPDPNQRTSSGGTALHRMVEKLLRKEYFPDLPGYYVAVGVSPRDLYSDDERAAYLREAFPLMLQAGYCPTVADKAGRTVVQLLKEGYRSYGEAAAGLRRRNADEGHLRMQVAIREALELCGERAPLSQPGPAASTPAAGGAAGAAGSPASTPRSGATASTVAGAGIAAPQTPEALASASRAPRMPFGKHRDWLLTELPASYIEWMCSVEDFFDNSTSAKRTLLQDLLDLGLVRLEGGRAVPVVRTRKRSRYSWLEDDGYDGYDYGDGYEYGEEELEF